MYSDSNYTELCSEGFYWQKNTTGYGLDYWRKHPVLGRCKLVRNNP